MTGSKTSLGEMRERIDSIDRQIQQLISERARRAQEVARVKGEGLSDSELLAELNNTQAQLARAIGVSPMRISYVVKGARPVTADIALRLGRYFGQSAQY